MNIKLLALSSLMVATAALAQEEGETYEAAESSPAVEESAPAPAPAPAPAAAAESEAPAAEQPADASGDRFAVLHGNSYNTVGNQAASGSTVGGNVNKPYKMAGSKLVYLEPTLDNAVVSFGDKATYFIGMDNSANLGLLQAGYAVPGMGIMVQAAMGKLWLSEEDRDEESSTYRVSAGDDLGATFAMLLGGLDLNVKAEWLTHTTETSVDEKDKDNGNVDENEQDYWTLSLNAAISNDPSAKSFFWGASVLYTRYNYTTRHNKRENTSYASVNRLIPAFNMGLAVLNAENARVYLGLNSRLRLDVFDEIDKQIEGHFGLGIYTTPNILAELALGNCWMVYGGASHTWKLLSLETLTVDDGHDDQTAMDFRTGATTVSVGTRFKYNNYALEASIASDIFNNPLTGFSGGDMVTSISGYIFF